MSRTVTSVLHGITNIATSTMTERVRMKTKSGLVASIQNDLTSDLVLPHGTIKLLTSRGLHIAGAVTGFEGDEPETRAWIDGMVKGDVLWDVGANIGLYSMYAALRGDLDISSFEPSALNFGLMAEHIHLNQMGDRVKPFCIAFGDKTEITKLYGNADSVGHTSNNIGKAEDQFGEYEAKYQQAIPVFTMDDFVNFYNVKTPAHLKLDVDGVEAAILAGGKKVLSKIKTLMVEIEGPEDRQKELLDLIKSSGLNETDIPDRTEKTRNRLFVR